MPTTAESCDNSGVALTVERPVALRREPQPEAYTSAGLTLGVAARMFLRTFSAKVLVPATVLSAIARVALGGWRWWDLGVAAIILGVQPFTEWLIHTQILHAKPRRIGGRTVDSLLPRRHRQHHQAPKMIGLVLVPRRVLVQSVLTELPLMLVITRDWRLALSGMVTAYAMFLMYEWVHFLIHSTYKPRGRYFAYIYRAHRLHHYRNENYWHGVTIHLADHVLRTFPAKEAVPVSPTAFTLGVSERSVDQPDVAAAL